MGLDPFKPQVRWAPFLQEASLVPASARGPRARHTGGVGCVLVDWSRFSMADKVCQSNLKVTQSPKRASKGGRVGNPQGLVKSPGDAFLAPL